MLNFSTKDVGITLAIVVLGVLGVCGVVWNEMHWQEFAQAHACRVIGKEESRTVTTIGAKGEVGFSVIPGRTGWLCDDGVTYWR